MLYLVAAILVFVLIHEKTMEPDEIGGSKNFHMSQGMSKKMYNQMRKDEVPEKELKKFVQWEDRFLQIERISVCSGLPRFIDAISISDLIKRTFPKYDFSYHTIHLKQAAEPDKIINKSIKCQ
jgi:hypothetical protein